MSVAAIPVDQIKTITMSIYRYDPTLDKKPYMQDFRKTWVKVCKLANVRIEELVLLRHTWACLALIASK